ncbi:hypothetical protein [Mogibacterium pumilum]|uniref:Uncharacterized protein n=1 Tax=Mogibacterium pumilum TaxID=86332 RepID=A0A223AQ66_9FIRM|nr:hypothetical protein [Mogibacterium pumilum]ASS37099.1 hypothetical protein AXF17_00485 [Mogibacterium pumilum]
MKKVIIATITIILGIYICIIFICADLYIDHNLRKYSVFYAHNMEHKAGTHPELAMALENMDVIYKPNKKNIRYRDDGGFIIYNTFSDSERVIIKYNIAEKKSRYIFYDITDKDYFFDEAFRLEYGYDSSTGLDEIDAKTVDQEVLYKDIYKNFGFIFEANVNRKPRINLQKQFNKKYYKRFN